MRYFRYIGILLYVLTVSSGRAQYFYEAKTLFSKLHFTDPVLQAEYTRVKGYAFSNAPVEKFLASHPVTTEDLLPTDQLNLHILSALYNSSAAYARQALYHSRMSEMISEKNGGLQQDELLVMKTIVYRRLLQYDKSNQAADQYAALSRRDPVLLYQMVYLKALDLEQARKYVEAISLLEMNMPLASSLSTYDYYKCMDLLISLANKNEDNALALSYLLKHDSLIGRLENTAHLYHPEVYYAQKTLNSDDIQLLKVLSANNIGFMYQKLGDSQSAERYLLRSIKLLNECRKKSALLADIETNTGLTYTHLKQYTDAEKHYNTAYNLYKNEGNKQQQSQILNMLAKNSLLKSQVAMAVAYCEESLKLSLPSNDWENSSDSYFILSEIYAYSSDYNKSQYYYKEYARLRKILEQKTNQGQLERESAAKKLADMEAEISDDIDHTEKRRLEIIRIKLESAQKEQELLLLKKDNELKEQSLINQKLEKAQAQKSLALIREQLEKQQLEQKYKASQKERELKRVENLNYQNQLKLLNSQKELVTKENVLKEQELLNNRSTQRFLFTGICFISLFLVFALYAFFRNRKQTKIIQKNMVELEQLSGELRESNGRLESSVVLLNDQKRIIEEKNNLIIDSIDYSSKIQKALFMDEEQLRTMFASAFILNLPRDIVSGDFYMVRQKGDLTYVAVVDCTGHGVPGSLISIIGYQEISHLLDTFHLSPSGYLKKLNRSINQLVNNNNDFGSDGMDVMLLEINGRSGLMRFAGARNYLIVYSGGQMREFRGDRISIGERPGDDVEFNDMELELKTGDTLYLFTDGYQDQQIEKTGKRLGSRTFKEFIRQHAGKTLDVQRELFLDFFVAQKGSLRQTDDVTLMAIQPKLNSNLKAEVMLENQRFRKLLHHISGTETMPDNLVVVYGKMSQDIIVSTIRLIERKLILGQYSKSLITRVKILSTEMMQNVKKHQTIDDQVPPYFVINFDAENLYIYSGNLVESKEVKFLKDKLDHYKNMELAVLRDVYMNTFINTSLSPEGNAGLGLLTILYKSNRRVSYDMVQLSQGSYYYNLEVSLRIKENTLNV